MTGDTLPPLCSLRQWSGARRAAFDDGRINSDGRVILALAAEQRLQLAYRNDAASKFHCSIKALAMLSAIGFVR